MHKKIVALFCFLLIAFFSVGCEHKTENEQRAFFPTKTEFHVGIQADTFKTRICFFFDENGACHVLHEDPTSPLFGLEEIFTPDSVNGFYSGMQFQNLPYCGGIGTVYRALVTIRETKPLKITKDGEKILYTYENEHLSMVFKYSEKGSLPLTVFGTDNGNEFSINFSADA
ncbi:MAG: hypothetical protein E7580_03840 [Ruminococcaceae bacterium]|nr:hypothetical protein [Oscillospiraceae bacterium]